MICMVKTRVTCSSCGAGDPWENEPLYSFDEDDLPISFEGRFAADNWELWDDFCQSYFGDMKLKGEDVAGLSSTFPK